MPSYFLFKNHQKYYIIQGRIVLSSLDKKSYHQHHRVFQTFPIITQTPNTINDAQNEVNLKMMTKKKTKKLSSDDKFRNTFTIGSKITDLYFQPCLLLIGLIMKIKLSNFIIYLYNFYEKKERNYLYKLLMTQKL